MMCELCDLNERGLTRRRLMIAGAAALLLPPGMVHAAGTRELSFHHTHTGERLRVEFAPDGALAPEALGAVSEFLRDFRSGEIHPIDPRLLDILRTVQHVTGGRGPYEIISAYRSPDTNTMLRSTSTGVAERSLHMQGRALDVRLRGVDTDTLRTAALALQAGGVGYYPDSDFIHVDTGRVRYW